MKYALENDQRIEPTPKTTATCLCCGSEVVAKCGTKKVWHWAHKSKQMCDHWWENETQWHRDWKNCFPREWQEVVHFAVDGEKHIADLKTPSGLIIEFQHSRIKRAEIEQRSNFYHNMVWIIDGNKYKKERDWILYDFPKNAQVEDFDYSSDLPNSVWSGLNVPIFFDVKYDDWLIGQIPQFGDEHFFYKRHFLKKEYFCRTISKSGNYRPGKMRPPTD